MSALEDHVNEFIDTLFDGTEDPEALAELVADAVATHVPSAAAPVPTPHPLLPSPLVLIEQYGEPDDVGLEDEGVPTNLDRAGWALEAAMVFNRRTSSDPYDVAEFDAGALSEVGGDLVCDLLHLAVVLGVDPDDLIETGRRHFCAEVGVGYAARAAS